MKYLLNLWHRHPVECFMTIVVFAIAVGMAILIVREFRISKQEREKQLRSRNYFKERI